MSNDPLPIQSTTHREPDAILGSGKLNFKIDNCDGTSQIINCPFLVLKEHLSLPTILLGNQFLYQTNCNMEYNEAGFINVKVNGKYVKNYLCPSSEAIYFSGMSQPSDILPQQKRCHTPSSHTTPRTKHVSSPKSPFQTTLDEVSIFKDQEPVS